MRLYLRDILFPELQGDIPYPSKLLWEEQTQVHACTVQETLFSHHLFSLSLSLSLFLSRSVRVIGLHVFSQEVKSTCGQAAAHQRAGPMEW